MKSGFFFFFFLRVVLITLVLPFYFLYIFQLDTFYFNHVSCRVSLLSWVPLLGWVYVHLLLSVFWCGCFICFTLPNIWPRNFFDEGCDASVPLDDSNGYKNHTLRGVDKVDFIKEELEKAWPGVLSCADVFLLILRVLLANGFSNSLRLIWWLIVNSHA